MALFSNLHATHSSEGFGSTIGTIDLLLCKTAVAKMAFKLLAFGGCVQDWDGVGLSIGACNSGLADVWEIHPSHHDHSVKIIRQAYGLCLDHQFNLAKVILHTCHGGDNQQWQWMWYDDLSIRNRRDGKCLEVHQNHLVISPCTGRKAQRFAAVPSTEVPSALDTIIRVVLSSLALFVLARLTSCCKNSRQSGQEVQAQEQAPIDTCKSKAEQKLDALGKVMATIDTKVTHMTTVLEGQGPEDSCSDCTVGSWTHVVEDSCCFLPDTFLKKASDVGHEFVLVQNLSQGDQVVAANGTVIKVLRPPEQHRVHAVIELQAGPSCLIVTPDHRIVIPGGTVQAKDLEVGCDVLLDETRAKLTSMEWRLEPTMVLKVSFSPDLPVAGFLRPPAILSKGTREKPVVRRGTRKPGKVEDNPTIPDTEPPLTP